MHITEVIVAFIIFTIISVFSFRTLTTLEQNIIYVQEQQKSIIKEKLSRI